METLQINFDAYFLSSVLKFLELADLTIVEKIISATSKDAQVCVVFSGKNERSIKDAEDFMLLEKYRCVTIYGVFGNDKNLAYCLERAKENYKQERETKLQSISVFLEKLNTATQ